MQKYSHKDIEKKWQEKWNAEGIYKTKSIDENAKKCYVLDMFPYPSGEGLHVGHPKGYIATDIYSRYKRMNGFNVLHPMGWDAFGLPAEQYAIKNKIHPAVAVEKNINNFKSQLAHLGLDYDWSREVNTTDPKFYKWTQWIFKQLYKKGLAYESNEPINWCPSCKTGLANEDLDSGACERCGSVVEKKPLRQWVLKITDYADRMIADLDKLAWPEGVKTAQKNWIGKSEGVEIDFKLNVKDREPGKFSVKVFTTRADTIYGATFIAISADLAQSWIDAGWQAGEEVKSFIKDLQEKQKIKVTDHKAKDDIEKVGIDTTVMAVNPVSGEEVPVWIANYVLSDYGTGAIMAVPAHDERDNDFAKKYNLNIRKVVQLEVLAVDNWARTSKQKTSIDIELFTHKGMLINSGEYNGMRSDYAINKIVEKIGGKFVSQYKLQDWVFARQRYWGEPFPIVFDQDHKSYVVADSELPILLPEVESYEPTDNGESPLASIKSFTDVYGYIDQNNEFVSCDSADARAKLFRRETNTMPQWAGSSWYYLRYCDPNNDKEMIDKDIEKAWAPVDVYVGGDHATRHLIYARFWHKFLFDIGVVSQDEPFARLEFLGFILAEDGRKMSKRWGNIINPDDVVHEFGADTMRVYEMFMAPFEATAAWNTSSIKGSSRFVERVYNLKEKIAENSNVATILNKTIKKVGEDIEAFKFNTAISQMMICLNTMEEGEINLEDYKKFIQILAPFAPHIVEDLWESLEEKDSIHISSWPVYDEAKIVDSSVVMAIQINGKVRGTIETEIDKEDKDIIELLKNTDTYKKYIVEAGIEPKKIIVVKNKIISIVI